MSAQTLWAADALWCGRAIVARLQDQVPALREVLLLDELKPGAKGPRQTPAAVVMLHDMQPTGMNAATKVTMLDQAWLVALAVRSARGDGAANNAALGVLIPPVIKALQGWVPPDQLRALTWVRGPKPNYGVDLTCLPLLFSIQVVTA